MWQASVIYYIVFCAHTFSSDPNVRERWNNNKGQGNLKYNTPNTGLQVSQEEREYVRAHKRAG